MDARTLKKREKSFISISLLSQGRPGTVAIDAARRAVEFRVPARPPAVTLGAAAMAVVSW